MTRAIDRFTDSQLQRYLVKPLLELSEIGMREDTFYELVRERCGLLFEAWALEVMSKGGITPIIGDAPRFPEPPFFTTGTVVPDTIGEESHRVSSGNPVAVVGETAVEHLKNAQQVARGLQELLEGKGLAALAADVQAVYNRIERAREEIGKGNIGR